jgi:hypothetical protein
MDGPPLFGLFAVAAAPACCVLEGRTQFVPAFGIRASLECRISDA